MTTDVELPRCCPGCGLDLLAERPVRLGPLEHDPRGLTLWADRRVPLTRAEAEVFGAVLQARGCFISRVVIEDRIGKDGNENLISVFMSKLRRKFRDAGAPGELIETAHGRGYRLATELLEMHHVDA